MSEEEPRIDNVIPVKIELSNIDWDKEQQRIAIGRCNNWAGLAMHDMRDLPDGSRGWFLVNLEEQNYRLRVALRVNRIALLVVFTVLAAQSLWMLFG